MKRASITLLCLFCAGCETAPPPPSPAEEAILTAVANCVYSVPPVTDPGPVPPGLVGGKTVRATVLPGTDGRAFRYEGVSNRMFSCGVAVYGPVSDALRAAMRNRIDQTVTDVKPRLQKSHDPNAYHGDEPPAERSYWGIGQEGVLMLTRPPGADAPTLEVHVHDILVF
jgi:hypothetical protein